MVEVKLTKLKPKGTLSSELAMSKIHVSKNWVLEPRSYSKRKPDSIEGKKEIYDQNRVDSSLDSSDNFDDSNERKKRLNRDAQRAYRERKNNKLQTLEDTIETLQGLVKTWQNKYRTLESRLSEKEKRIEIVNSENQKLKKEINSSSISNKCPKCSKHPCKCTLANKISIVKSDDLVLFDDPSLQALIDNFKPMKAVSLGKRKQLKNHKTNGYSTDQLVSYPNNISSELPVLRCGLCSDESLCVCKQLDINESINNSNTGDSTDCSSRPDTCENCNNIETSCIGKSIYNNASMHKWIVPESEKVEPCHDVLSKNEVLERDYNCITIGEYIPILDIQNFKKVKVLKGKKRQIIGK